MNLNNILLWTAIISAGLTIGRRFGWDDGVTAALVVYALIPYRPTR